MASIFGDFRVRIDPWEVDYGEQTPLAASADDQHVDHEIEVSDAAWGAIACASDAIPFERVVFIDGVRRLEMRFNARQEERLIYGGFGSFAVGAVDVERSVASFGTLRVFRLAVLGSGERLPAPIHVRADLIYHPESTPSSEVDGPLRHIQKAMRLEEATLARDLCRQDTLTIVDGPLSFESERRGVALGYIKRVHQLYIPAKFIALLAKLPAGCRTAIVCHSDRPVRIRSLLMVPAPC